MGRYFMLEATMNVEVIEIESAYRRQALMEEARTARLLQEAKRLRSGFTHRTLQSLAAHVIALGSSIRDWYCSAGSQGYMPNLHLD